MTSVSKLVLVKIVHTIIWMFFASIIFYILFAGLYNQVNTFTWVAVGFVILEALILILFKWYCPLTLIARKYSDSQKDNFDIYLPNWIAKHNKTIFTIIFTVGLVLVIFRSLS